MIRWFSAAGALIALAIMLWMFDALRADLRSAAPMLPLTFAHADHTTVNCISCHHNFVDTTGQGLCFDCHLNHPDVRSRREEQFHGLCQDCHAERQRRGEDAGPLRACSGCHTGDDAP